MSGSKSTVLVVGATGFIGGRLIPVLLARGMNVRVVGLSPSRLKGFPWCDHVTVVKGDCTDSATLAGLFDGVDVAYFLPPVTNVDLPYGNAELSVACAERAGLKRLIILTGLPHASPSSTSSDFTDIFVQSNTVQTVTIQSDLIIGGGSAAFESIGRLSAFRPLSIKTPFAQCTTRPIAIADVLSYLIQAAEVDHIDSSSTWTIRGPEALTLLEMITIYQAKTGQKNRSYFPLPLLSPWFCRHLFALLTPVTGSIAEDIVAYFTTAKKVTCRDHAEFRPLPDGGLQDYATAIDDALEEVALDRVITRWPDDRIISAPTLPLCATTRLTTVYTDHRHAPTTATQEDLFAVIESIGGSNGWYSAPLLWRLRGIMDTLFGGPGLVRGRRSRTHLRVGDALDWWTVEALERPAFLRLHADMKVPGKAWLILEATTNIDTGQASYRQEATFIPRGLCGHIYWWAVFPFHRFVFPAMASAITEAADRR